MKVLFLHWFIKFDEYNNSDNTRDVTQQHVFIMS